MMTRKSNDKRLKARFILPGLLVTALLGTPAEYAAGTAVAAERSILVSCQKGSRTLGARIFYATGSSYWAVDKVRFRLHGGPDKRKNNVHIKLIQNGNTVSDWNSADRIVSDGRAYTHPYRRTAFLSGAEKRVEVTATFDQTGPDPQCRAVAIL